jgi:hypothetical protein
MALIGGAMMMRSRMFTDPDMTSPWKICLGWKQVKD